MLACVAALLWACLWRGALRWGGLALFALSLGLYAAASRPVLAFDAELRAVFARAEEDGRAHWTLMAPQRRSTYARDRLGAMLGIAPAEAERLAPPETCGERLCRWRAESGSEMALVRDAAGFEEACIAGAVVLTRAPPPADFTARCKPALLLDADALAREGGGFIYESAAGLRAARAIDPAAIRPWTPRATNAGDAQEM